MTQLTYISYAELLEDVKELSHQVRGKYDAICGVPRSGVLAASMMALHLHLPLIKPDQLHYEHRHKYPRVLVLDDSVYMGRSIRNFLSYYFIHAGVDCGAVYGSPVEFDGQNMFKVIGRMIPLPRYFAWNLFHHPDLEHALLDIDGVLCEDPKRPAHAVDCNVHGDKAWHADEEVGSWYEDSLNNARPLWLPSRPVGGLVTNRLEKFRPQTYRWLKQHGIEYGSLIMAQFANANDRRAVGDYGGYKGRVLKDSQCKFMIESSDSQARRITEVSGKPCICTDTQKAYNPS